MGIYEKLLNIQTTLKAPKGQFNKFGNYKYRNCEDILESLKPLLFDNKVVVLINDDIVAVNDRIYIKTTVTLKDTESEEKIETTAFAREEETKKGMDSSQITGSASSYARKYALNAMFAIDDTKDSDTTNQGTNNQKENRNTQSQKKDYKNMTEKEKIDTCIKFISANRNEYNDLIESMVNGKEIDKIPLKELETIVETIKIAKKERGLK